MSSPLTLHDKLARPQQPVLGAQLVAVLGRNLVEVHRQLAEGELIRRGENLRHRLLLCLKQKGEKGFRTRLSF